MALKAKSSSGEVKMAEEKLYICVWKKLYERKSATSFDENPNVKCKDCDGSQRRGRQCSAYLSKEYVKSKRQHTKIKNMNAL